jgi:hypothetical protein
MIRFALFCTLAVVEAPTFTLSDDGELKMFTLYNTRERERRDVTDRLLNSAGIWRMCCEERERHHAPREWRGTEADCVRVLCCTHRCWSIQFCHRVKNQLARKYVYKQRNDSGTKIPSSPTEIRRHQQNSSGVECENAAEKFATLWKLRDRAKVDWNCATVCDRRVKIEITLWRQN